MSNRASLGLTSALCACALALLLAGCGDDDAGCLSGASIACTCTDGRSGAQTCGADGTFAACACESPLRDSGAMCRVDADCGDGTFCNGAERCAPSASGADARGCVAAAASACAAGENCDEAAAACRPCAGASDLDADGVSAVTCGGADCDDGDARRYPGNTEVCDAAGLDDDCNESTLGVDGDGDGETGSGCCNASGGTPRCGTDCDDRSSEINSEAPEACNAVDDDCDGFIDEDPVTRFWPDADFDLRGDANSAPIATCVPPGGYVANSNDCNDSDATIYRGAPEICDRKDNACVVDGGVLATEDADSDGHAPTTAACLGGPLPKDDCDDTNAARYPRNPELCNSVDDDCDARVDDFTEVCSASPTCSGTRRCIAGAFSSCGCTVRRPTLRFDWFHAQDCGWGSCATTDTGGSRAALRFYLNAQFLGAATLSSICAECAGRFTGGTTFAPSDPTIVTHWRGDGTDVIRVEKSTGGLIWYVRAQTDFGTSIAESCVYDVTGVSCDNSCAPDFAGTCGAINSTWTAPASPP